VEDGSDESEYQEEDSEGDSEVLTLNKSSLTKERRREEIRVAKEEEAFLKSMSLSDFNAESQPDDKTRQRMSLLSLAPDKIWTKDDLNEENNMRLGLRLLHNKIQGKSEFHLGCSIHIRYLSFPQDTVTVIKCP
jgi:hypothetical protein